MKGVELKGKDLISSQDWSMDEIELAMDLARSIKAMKYAGDVPQYFRNRTFFMLFYNTSTRTRASFEAAATLLGGHAQFIDFATTRGAEGESVKDMAKMYERMGHALGVRILESAVDYVYGRGNAVVREYAQHARIPVINMADDMFHPSQAITDLYTLREKFSGHLSGRKYVIMWAYSDRVRSWGSVQDEMLLATRYGMDVVLAHPPGFELDENLLELARRNAEESGGSLTISHDLKSSMEGADVVFPRSWASHECVITGLNRFGREKEVELHNRYRDWRLTQQLVDLMSRRGVITHVLPVFRGQEADDEVMDSERSVIYDQAENLLYVRAAILALVAGSA
ncbi:N-acetylornithine carbamoyltransferase [archaeon HR01]|nr:N-acetylornithine carbamoyltransferase [archaeon HR01]